METATNTDAAEWIGMFRAQMCRIFAHPQEFFGCVVVSGPDFKLAIWICWREHVVDLNPHTSLRQPRTCPSRRAVDRVDDVDDDNIVR